MASARPTIKVATWNIRAGIGPGEPFPPAWWRHVDRARLARIGEIIASLDADVVGLQEVALLTPNGELIDEPSELARLTGMHVRYAAVHAFALIDPENGNAIGAATWGNALLTRDEVVDGFAMGLPTGGDDDLVEPAGSGLPLAGVPYGKVEPGVREPRCAVGGRVRVRGAGAFVVNAHLTYAGTDQRRAQAESLTRIATEMGAPVLVIGDFNGPIESPALESLADAFEDAFAAVGIEPGDPRRASCGPQRIDHLLTRGLRATECEVFDDAGDASDHLPVIATFDVLAG